jgi:hypothetical protein
MTDNIKPFLKATTPHNEHAIAMLEQWLEDAQDGKIVSVGLIGRRPGGEWQTSFSSSDNRLEDASMLFELAIRRLGFAQKEKNE